jgi:hypothetical protein
MQPYTRTQIYFRPLAGTTRLLCLLTAFLIVSCLPTLAQNADNPQDAQPLYLSTVKPLPGPEPMTSTATILTKRYPHSVSLGGYNGMNIDIRYAMPEGYTQFHTLVGIDDKFSYDKCEFEFTIISRNEDGKESVLKTKTVSPSSKPQEINVSVKDTKILILRLRTTFFENGGHLVNPGVPWWCEAQLTKVPIDPPDDPMTKLAEKLANGLDAKALSLNRFVLNPDGFDDTITQTVQNGLCAALKKKGLDVTNIKQTINNQPIPGDDLDEKTRTILRDMVDTRFLILGRISNRENEMVVAASVYDLRTGKSIKDGQVIITKPPPPPMQVTLSFIPNRELRINSYQWFVDDQTNGPKHLSLERTIGNDTVDVQPGKHMFKLIWNGNGKQNKDKNDYVSGTVEEFQVEITKNTSIEMSAKVIPEVLTSKGKLEITVRVNVSMFHPKWH